MNTAGSTVEVSILQEDLLHVKCGSCGGVVHRAYMEGITTHYKDGSSSRRFVCRWCADQHYYPQVAPLPVAEDYELQSVKNIRDMPWM